MNRILRKDPIVEVRCEFRFDSPDWDWTVPGLLWGQIRDDFPLKQQFDMVPANAPDDTKESLGVTQLAFWNQEKTALVQTEPNELGIVQRTPYQGWPKFKAVIEQVLQSYREIGPSGKLVGISLRYLNVLPLPSEIGVHDYLTVYPRVPVRGNVPLGRWMQQAEFVASNEIVMSFRVGCISSSPQKPLDLVTVIDITASDLSEDLPDGAEMRWLETAHSEIEDLFFACLKPPYLEILELEENDES